MAEVNAGEFKNAILKSLSHKYTHATIIALDEIVINVRKGDI